MRRPDNEPLLFDLPLDRPARDDEAEPVLERQPQGPARPPRAEAPPPRTPQRPSRQPQAGGRAPAVAAAPGSRQPAVAPASQRPRGDRQDPRAEGGAPPPRPSSLAELPGLPFAAAPAAAAAAAGDPPAGKAAGGAATAGAGRVSVARRLAAGAADLLVHVAVTILALGGCRYLGVAPAVNDWPAFTVFLLAFSFLYTVVPLAFWGHTLGMTWAGLSSESTEGEPLSFDQTARRWLGGLLTLATLGLALLLAFTGRSLADRLSGSRTLSA